MSKDVRLLPAVIGVGAILFALKIFGVAFTAGAAEANAPSVAPATAGAPPSHDPTAAINAALPMPHPDASAAAGPPQPALSPELEGAGVTSAEMDVLTSLSDRRGALDERERDLQLKANLLTATERRVDQKIADLKALQVKIQELIDQSQTLEKAQIDSLVKAYSGMKPADAARIFATLDDQVRLAVAQRMKPDALAGILAKMPAADAQKLTVELATRLKIEEAATHAASVAVATPIPSVPAVPQTVAALTPPQSQAPATQAPAPAIAATAPPQTPAAPPPASPATTAPASTPAPAAPQVQASVPPSAPPSAAPVAAPIAPVAVPVAPRPAPAVPAHAPVHHAAAAPAPQASRAPAPLQAQPAQRTANAQPAPAAATRAPATLPLRAPDTQTAAPAHAVSGPEATAGP